MVGVSRLLTDCHATPSTPMPQVSIKAKNIKIDEFSFEVKPDGTFIYEGKSIALIKYGEKFDELFKRVMQIIEKSPHGAAVGLDLAVLVRAYGPGREH